MQTPLQTPLQNPLSPVPRCSFLQVPACILQNLSYLLLTYFSLFLHFLFLLSASSSPRTRPLFPPGRPPRCAVWLLTCVVSLLRFVLGRLCLLALSSFLAPKQNKILNYQSKSASAPSALAYCVDTRAIPTFFVPAPAHLAHLLRAFPWRYNTCKMVKCVGT